MGLSAQIYRASKVGYSQVEEEQKLEGLNFKYIDYLMTTSRVLQTGTTKKRKENLNVMQEEVHISAKDSIWGDEAERSTHRK